MSRVRYALKKIDGVIRYDINANEKSLLITFDDKATTQKKIMGQLAEQGYRIEGRPEVTSKASCP